MSISLCFDSHNDLRETNPFDKNAINRKYAHVCCRHVYGWSAKKREREHINTSLDAYNQTTNLRSDRQSHLFQPKNN